MRVFGEQLQVFRNDSRDPQRGGHLTQQALAQSLQELLGLREWPRPQTISDWERGQKRLDPDTDRNVLVAILQVLARCGGLPHSHAANRWLTSGGYAPLFPQERTTVFPNGDARSQQTDGAWRARLEAPTYTRLFGVERSLAQLRALLERADAPWTIALEGLGGLGKTALAHELTSRLLESGVFADLAWISARPSSLSLGGTLVSAPHPVLSVEEAERSLAAQLLGAETASELLRPQDRRQMLQEHLSAAPHLLIIDNLESLADGEQLLPLLQRFAKPAKFLLTSRQRLPGPLYHYPVPALEEADALALLRHAAETSNLPHVAAATDDQLRPLFQIVGGNPLALHLAVGQLHLRELASLVADWQQAAGREIEALYTFIYRTAWERLEESCRFAFLAMPLAAEQGGRLAHLVAASGLAESEMVAALEQLVTLNLVNVQGSLNDRRFSIHSLTRSFLHRQVAEWWN